MTGGVAAGEGRRLLRFWRACWSSVESSPRFGVVISVIAAVYVLFIYSNIAELLTRIASVGPPAARVVIYSAFGAGVVATVAYTVRSRPRSRWPLLLLAYTAAMALLVLVHAAILKHGVGLATKSLLAGIFQLIGFGFILGLRPARSVVNVSTIVVLVITAAFCASDLMVVGLFSEIPGRGAGLYFNPNIAALAVLLGGLGIVPALPPSWRLTTAAIVAVTLIATLSRSGLLIALVVVSACAAPIYVDVRKNGAAYRTGAWSAAAILIVAFAYFSLAYYSPTPFASKVAWAQSHIVGSPIAEAKKNAADRSSQGALNKPPVGTTGVDCTSWTAVIRGLRKAQACAWLDPWFIDKQQNVNSGAARILFALRGVAAFFDAPWLGSGLDRAFSLRPHNSYLLFGIAYGVLGLLVVPGVCLFIYLRTGLPYGLPLIVFVVVASLFSHDIFLSRDLVAGLAIALSTGERAWQT